MQPKISITVWADLICPYCLLGKTRLEKALQSSSFQGHYEITHRAFRLAPGAKTQKIADALAGKFGVSKEEVAKMHSQLEAQAAKDGLTYNLSGTLYGDTIESQSLALWSKTKNAQPQLVEALYRAYFTEGLNIFDRNVLLDLVAKTGLNREEAEEVLKTERFKKEVESDEAEARSLNVTGVPFFVFENKYAISGAQPVATFENFLEEINSAGS